MPEYVVVPDVELVTVGTWHGTPTTTFTLEDLVDMLVAANDDPLITAARVKLGHDRWQLHPEGAVALGDYDPFWGGEPAFGSVRDLRLDEDGVRLIGDFHEVPAWLADALPSAWPNRSIEWRNDVETEGGRRYSRVLTAVALLGVRLQAVSDLADIQRILEGDPELVEFPA